MKFKSMRQLAEVIDVSFLKTTGLDNENIESVMADME